MNDVKFDFQAAGLVTEKLDALSASYESTGGSNSKTMGQVRSLYSKIVPFNTKNWRHRRTQVVEDDSESESVSKKKERKWDWMSRAESGPSSRENCSESAFRCSSAVERYQPDIIRAVEGFNNWVKPFDFPSNLSKELLQGKYIDLRRVKSEFLAEKRGMAPSLMLAGKDKDLELQNKKIHQRLTDSQDWF
ncbi:hypothetical protein DFH28DRAFT_1121665 [Melampsora americana]|nr:hypothetical protein DFH28DRAFT_1121665 [Melampsora americana]